jgi:hypothetical protein
MAFAQWVKVHRMTIEVASEPKQTFWNMTINLLFDTAALEWAKVFGSHNNGIASAHIARGRHSRDTCRDL